MAEASPRLALALDKDLLALPEAGNVLWMNPPGDVDLAGMAVERVHAVQPHYPDHHALTHRGMSASPDMDAARYAVAIVTLPRAKARARGLIAAAAQACDGTVIVDGAKTDGVDSILKDVRARAEIEGVFSKAHGKIFWFSAAGVDWSDWLAAPSQADGYATAPGVFSADGIDPASALLADHLPEKMGAHVVDLGAGWGYLSARVLAHAAPDRIDLVEADHDALACARRNVTDDRARFFWADARDWTPDKGPDQKVDLKADTVVMNPPFHTGRIANPDLGRAFIANAARLLKPKGVLWMVANRHLPYETALQEAFARVDEIGGDRRFKILRAERPTRRRG